MGSKSFSLDMADVWSLFKNAGLVAVAAFLTVIMNGIGSLDLGQYTALIIPVITVALDTVIKWAKNNTEEESS